MSSVAAWVALALASLSVACLLGAAVLARLAWKRVAPSIAPLLQAFSPPAPRE